jgi:hypothetical protein
MNYVIKLKKELIALAEDYGKKTFGNNYANPTELKNSSVIFNDISYSFQTESWDAISKDKDYSTRAEKIHPNTQTKEPAIFEMQSSNSSDALAMNIFCHPGFKKWKGVTDLFELEKISSLVFGFKAKVIKNNSKSIEEDKTEVDVFINNSIIVECKLTEEDFCSKEKDIVEQYSEFENVFYTNKLLQSETHYKNYQLIRNILAANQNNAQFMLICDMRRPDLVKSFQQTVTCIKDQYLDLRTNCKIVYWQDIAKVVGVDLKNFLNEKYGIN